MKYGIKNGNAGMDKPNAGPLKVSAKKTDKIIIINATRQKRK